MGTVAEHIRALAERVGHTADAWLFPRDVACLCCDRALSEEARDGLCPSCKAALDEAFARMQESKEPSQPLPPGLDYVHAAFSYDAQARRLITQLKFQSLRSAAVPLARAMSMMPAGEEDVIVPVPTTKRRLRERGFNQAALLAQWLGRQWKMPVCEALERSDTHAAQVTLSARQRRRNLVGCMRAVKDVAGKRVLLVDDVYTTGSTAQEAVRALLEGGAAGVGMMAAARTLTVEEEKLNDLFTPRRK